MSTSPTAPESGITPAQRRIVLSLWLTYAILYLGRFNLSVAIPDLAESLNITRSEAGILGSVWLWTYAVGQVIAGQMGNRMSPRRLIALGIGAVALSNLAFGFGRSLPVLAIIWSVDGFFFSLGWGPILRIVSQTLSLEQRARISALFPMNIPVGTAFAWLGAGLLLALGGWRWAFWGAGAVLLLLLVWFWRTGIDATATARSANVPRWTPAEIWYDLTNYGAAFIISGVVGFFFLSALIWLPTYVKDTGVVSDALLGATSSILPLVGVGGMLASAFLLARLRDVIATLLIFLLGGGGFLLLASLAGMELRLFFLLLTMTLAGGLVGMALSSVPMTLAAAERASSVAGMSTAIFSVVGGVGSIAIGALADSANWETVFGVWGLALLLAAGVAWLARKHG